MNILSLSPRQASLQWATGPIMSSGIEVAHQKCVEMSKLQKTDLWLETNEFFPFPLSFSEWILSPQTKKRTQNCCYTEKRTRKYNKLFRMLFFNTNHGYLEGLVRGFKNGLLNQGFFLGKKNLIKKNVLSRVPSIDSMRHARGFEAPFVGHVVRNVLEWRGGNYHRQPDWRASARQVCRRVWTHERPFEWAAVKVSRFH